MEDTWVARDHSKEVTISETATYSSQKELEDAYEKKLAEQIGKVELFWGDHVHHGKYFIVVSLFIYTTLHHLTPPYTTLHHLTPPYTTLHHLTPPYTTLHHLTCRNRILPNW